MTIYVSIIVTEEKNEKVRTCQYSLQQCQGQTPDIPTLCRLTFEFVQRKLVKDGVPQFS